jgi:sarcosine oxidase subunit delta
MRIPCPHCGDRSSDEFTYFGDAAPRRPDTGRPDPLGTDAMTAFVAYVYERDNPAGLHRELWYHGFGCRQWLVVTRDLTSHQVAGAQSARDVALQGGPRQQTGEQPAS